jgi:hypothetical protein
MERRTTDGAGVGALAGSALAAGAVHGALLFGAVVSLLHVLHDRVESAWNASVLLVASALCYGLAAALAFGGAAAVVGLGSRLLRRPASRHAAVLAGAFLFDAVFLFFVANWGLTYDDVPFGETPGMTAYLAYVALRTVWVVLVALLVAWTFARAWRRLRERRRGLAAAAVFALFLALHAGLALAWGPRPEATASEPGELADLPAPETLRPPVPVVLVGADGADWRVIRPLLAAGEMPNLAAMLKEGAQGDLASLPDANSAVLWASIYSGLAPDGPAGHGVLDFYTIRLAGMTEGVFPVHRTGFKELAGKLEGIGLAERRTVDRSSVDSPLLWEVAAGMGRSVGVVDGYYFSYPAPPLPGEDDFFLAYGSERFYQRNSPGGPGGRGRRPLSTAREAAEYARPPELLDRLGEALTGWEFEWQSDALLRLLDEGARPDFVNFYAHQPDAVLHWRWRSWQPELYPGGAGDQAGMEDEIPAFHRDLDRFLGELRERVGPEAVIVLLSDHGHSPTLLHAMDTQHRHGPPGILAMAGGPVRPGVTVEGADLYDVFPTVLHLLGLPVPESGPGRPGRVLEEVFKPAWLARAPVTTTPGYRPLLPIFLPSGEGTGAGDEERRREEMEKLKALGYVQ